MRWISAFWSLVISLIVDDGFLAVFSLVAIGVTYLLTRDAALGGADAAGWVLVGLVAGGVGGSVRRGLRRLPPELKAPPGQS